MKAKRIHFYVWLIAIFLIMHSCMQMRTSDKQTLKVFAEKGVEVAIKRYEKEAYSIRYLEVAETKDTLAPVVIFVHGAPGSSDAFFVYLQDSLLREEAILVAVDRPGYGYSNFGKAEASIEKQADLLQPLLSVYKGHKLILVGHSYGGSIIAKMAMENNVDGLLFLAPAIDPDNELKFWITNLGKYPPTRWITPKALEVATDEKWVHASELKKMESDWNKINCAVVYMHGKEDDIVPYVNYDFAKEKLAHCHLEMVSLPEEGHFFLWTKEALVKEKLISLLKRP